MEIIHVTGNDEVKSIYPVATKIMHLDFIWIGVGGRLGCSISEFAQSIREFELFDNV